tara:strand:- start:9645 stop:10844 length:1200 start_codon:yes stop_codon:yes gene_type:complete
MSLISRIDKHQMCLGCGLCEGLSRNGEVKTVLGKDGFLHPKILQESNSLNSKIKEVCPSLNVSNIGGENELWGNIENIYSGYAIDKEVRHRGSSGGIGSGLAIYLLEKNIVDGILHVGSDIKNYKSNSLKISRNRLDVLNNASSRYAPALIFNNFFNILENTSEKFGFIGKPCDVSAINNLRKYYPQIKNRIKFTIAIFCAGMPSYRATKELIDENNPKHPITDLQYRGNGWPGNFSFKDNDNYLYEMSYNDTWGRILNKHLHFRCKICPDGIGLEADFVIGDSWETESGYPDFSEKDGKSLVISRTTEASAILNRAFKDNYLHLENENIERLKYIQPYQYHRRMVSGIRLIPVKLLFGLKINFINTFLWKNILTLPYNIIFREFVGALKRTLKIKFKL